MPVRAGSFATVFAAALSLAVAAPADLVAASAAAPVTHCPAKALKISVTGGGAGLSHHGWRLVFTNVSKATCTLTGYPHVFLIRSHGPALGVSRTRSGYLGGIGSGAIPSVRLAPGAKASALLEGLAFGAGGDACPAQPRLSVTPPQAFTPTVVTETTDICSDVQVHPVVGVATA
jgi:Protein of unknown function (DUF4232)